METIAEVGLRGIKQIAPGEEAFARLKLANPALLLPGDRFILRQFSPVVTIGGGTVLDASPVPRMPGQSDFEKVLAEGNSEVILRARIARRQHAGVSISKLVSETGWTKSVLESLIRPLTAAGKVARLGDLLIDACAAQALKSQILAAAEVFHKKNPLQGGVNKEELRAQVDASQEVFEMVAASLLRERRIEVVGDIFRLPGQGVVMKDEEAESKKKIEDAFASAGLKVPALREVLAGLKVDLSRAQKIVTLLLRDRVLLKVSDELVFHRSALEQLRRQMAAQKIKSASIDVAGFKELTGVSRKYAIPLLEYLDRERVTRRVGDSREIL
jgi:selenocysteine-specific elongation factor